MDIELVLALARERSEKRLADMKAKRQRAINKILVEYHGRDVAINHEVYLWNTEKGYHETYWSLKQPSGETVSVREKLQWFLAMGERRKAAPQIWCNL